MSETDKEPGAENPSLARAERLVADLEARAIPIARAIGARAIEMAEDIWAEAQSRRRQIGEREKPED
jgi:hypothetical protein